MTMTATLTMTDDDHVVEAPDTGPSPEERTARLTEGADRLVGGRRSIMAHPQLLLIVAGSLMTSGLVIVLLGWVGAAHSVLVEEQVPYLISGGFLGGALATIGAVMVFAHWLTVLIRENRQHEAIRRQDHVELMGALAQLSAALGRQGVDGQGVDGQARPARSTTSRR
jgi:hypothetical protein